jgi:hypothetical protein
MDALFPYCPALQGSQMNEPAMELNEPEGQAVQAAAPVLEKVPTGQLRHWSSPRLLKVPFSQTVHTALPGKAATVPLVQSKQRVAFSLD